MTYQPTPKQALFLWRTMTAEAAEEREPKQSDTRPKLSPTERRPLLEHGFMTLDKRGRSMHCVLTDRAWAWAAETVDVELMQSNSRVGAEALQGLLRRLLPFLQAHDLPLASVLAPPSGQTPPPPQQLPSAPPETVPEVATTSDGATDAPLSQRIERACLVLGDGQHKTRVRLSDLRAQLTDVPRQALDDALIAMQDAQRLVLYRDDHTARLTPADHAAALYVGDAPRHLVYLEH